MEKKEAMKRNKEKEKYGKYILENEVKKDGKGRKEEKRKNLCYKNKMMKTKKSLA